MIIVSDTSPIANLIQIGALNLLHQLFGRVIIPPTVEREILALKKFGVDLTAFENSSWIEIISPIDIPLLNQIKNDLDEGESEAIVVAKELHADYILIDERLGTKKAQEIGLQTVGLLGVLIKAKNEKHIEKVKPILDALIDKEHKLNKSAFFLTHRHIGHIGHIGHIVFSLKKIALKRFMYKIYVSYVPMC